MEGSEGYKGDDSHEIAAFMRMFMDMVGISDSDSIPAGKPYLFAQSKLSELIAFVHFYFLSHDIWNDVWCKTYICR